MEYWEEVAHVLEKAMLNMQASQASSNLTVFHSRKIPSISIYDFLARIHSFAGCSESCYLMAFIYIDRILQKNPDFMLSMYCIHRLILACVMMAIKFNDDIYYDNAFYAKVGGVTLHEMNCLEVALLSLTQFDLSVNSEIYQNYVDELKSHIHQPCKVTCITPMETGECCVKITPSPSSLASISTVPSKGELA